MKKPRVLIVEDESSIAELIAVNLRHNGFEPIWAEDGESAQREIDTLAPDLILLDWMLPGQSGLVLARQWRKDSRTKAIERIGDHAKNIAEFIIYIVKGADVRHTSMQEIESALQ